MVACHGQGGADQVTNIDGGCCYVNGAICPLRLKQVNGHIFNNLGVDLGTTTQYINSLTNNGAARNRAQQQAQGVTFFCKAAISVIVADASLTAASARAAFNTAWNNQADYVALVRPAWEAIEQIKGLPSGSYNCSTWHDGTCCFSESQVVNDAKFAALNTTAVTVRKAGGV